VQEAFEMIQSSVPVDVGDALTFQAAVEKSAANQIRGHLPMGMDVERLSERTYYILSAMSKSVPKFLRYM
jgi:hypothetical protein